MIWLGKNLERNKHFLLEFLIMRIFLKVEYATGFCSFLLKTTELLITRARVIIMGLHFVKFLIRIDSKSLEYCAIYARSDKSCSKYY